MSSPHAHGGTRAATAMTIAGFDPGSGAGVTADLLVFARFSMFATSAITALTVQSTRGVSRVQTVDASLLRATLEEIDADLPADGIKIGMLGVAPQVRVVAAFLGAVRRQRPITVVLDPVIVSSSGTPLLDAEGLDQLREDLIPQVDAVTPNLAEAALLTGMPCATASQAEACAAALAATYPGLVPVVTGGHLEPPADLVWQGSGISWIQGTRIHSRATHGTGCAFASALLARRLRGDSWLQAAVAAKEFVASAIRAAEPRGEGSGPIHLLGSIEETV